MSVSPLGRQLRLQCCDGISHFLVSFGFRSSSHIANHAINQRLYAFKQLQVENELAAEDLAGVPMVFFNVQSDDASPVREALFEQLNRMRVTVETRLLDLCAAADEVMKNHEAQSLTAAMEEVAEKLNSFLEIHPTLSARERHAYTEALTTIRNVRYASTLWAATRRSGEYSGLNVVHNIGIGAAKDARQRSERWFTSLTDYLAVLKGDEGLQLASRPIGEQAQALKFEWLMI